MGNYGNHSWGSNSGATDPQTAINTGDIADLEVAVDHRVEWVSSKVIDVPNEVGTIQEAIDLAGHFYSMSGAIVINLENGDHEVKEDLRCRHPNEIVIQAKATVIPLQEGDYSNNKPVDLVRIRDQYKVRIVNTGSNTFLGGNFFTRIHFRNVAILCRDTDSYCALVDCAGILKMTRCTVFGGYNGVSIYNGSYGYFRECSFVHQRNRSIYSQNGSSVVIDRTEVLFCENAIYATLGSSLYMLSSNVHSFNRGVYCTTGASAYVYGGRWSCRHSAIYVSSGGFAQMVCSPSRRVEFRGTTFFWCFTDSTFVMHGNNPDDFDVSGLTGIYLGRGLDGSMLRLARCLNENPGLTIRLDNSSRGQESGYTGTLSPPINVVGNSNSLWK